MDRFHTIGYLNIDARYVIKWRTRITDIAELKKHFIASSYEYGISPIIFEMTASGQARTYAT